MKANPTTSDHYKTNKLANRKYDNKVNESEIKTSNLDQVQQFFNEDTDVVFDTLVADDYIDEIDCTDGSPPTLSMTLREIQPTGLLHRGSQPCGHLVH